MEPRLLTSVLPLSASARTNFTARLVLCAAAAVAIFFGSAKTDVKQHSSSFARAPGSLSRDDLLDQDLCRTAATALGDREGAIIVMDPQTGRIRAVINPELAFAGVFAPGSTIKPFTALALLRSGLIDEQSRALCQGSYSHHEFHTVCSHPKNLPSFNTAEAIAYSCNYYFGKLGERLSQNAFNATLSEFGFGQRTGIKDANGARESAGRLLRAQWQAEGALGDGDHLQVTPIQLLTAYAALLNGGHLFAPDGAPAKGFEKQTRANLKIDPDERSVIVAGMRGAVRYGTAERATLYSLPLYIFGKTGTSTQTGGFRTQGWFVGFASALGDGLNTESFAAPESPKLAVLVFLKKAHGAEAAAVSRAIFETYALAVQGDAETRRREDRLKNSEAETNSDAGTARHGRDSVSDSPGSMVRVHLVHENINNNLPLEDYVLGVVAAEGSMENEPEALKALAVAARTYALKNLGRHAREGYDFCTTTHCQRYRPINSVASGAPASDLMVAAVKRTTGMILRDSEGEVVDSYFSASCGGASANIGTLWGGRAPSYLKGVGDEYCLTMPHHNWTDVISSTNLMTALRSDPRTDMGQRLVDVVVTRRDATARAELITIEGKHRRVVRGWDFKIIVGRALGWNLLKSSRFDVTRSGANFVFRGSGFGHGLGLCQEGAHVMAQRGTTYRDILRKYFPGTRIQSETSRTSVKAQYSQGRLAEIALNRINRRAPKHSENLEAKQYFMADLFWYQKLRVQVAVKETHAHRSSTARRTLSSEYFRINYPETVSQRDAEYLLKIMELNESDLVAHVSRSGLPARFPFLEVFVNSTTGDFVGRTGQPWWAAAATKGNRIELQPVALLKRRGIVETTLRHELVHALIDALGRGSTPRWLAEGLALNIAGEGAMISRYRPGPRISVDEIEEKLARIGSDDEMRRAYAAAYSEVNKLIKTEGEANVWRRVITRRIN